MHSSLHFQGYRCKSSVQCAMQKYIKNRETVTTHVFLRQYLGYFVSQTACLHNAELHTYIHMCKCSKYRGREQRRQRRSDYNKSQKMKFDQTINKTMQKMAFLSECPMYYHFSGQHWSIHSNGFVSRSYFKTNSMILRRRLYYKNIT